MVHSARFFTFPSVLRWCRGQLTVITGQGDRLTFNRVVNTKKKKERTNGSFSPRLAIRSKTRHEWNAGSRRAGDPRTAKVKVLLAEPTTEHKWWLFLLPRTHIFFSSLVAFQAEIRIRLPTLHQLIKTIKISLYYSPILCPLFTPNCASHQSLAAVLLFFQFPNFVTYSTLTW